MAETETKVKFAGLYKVIDTSSNWSNVSNGAIGFGQWQDNELGTDVSAKLIYANGITYNVADALKLRDVSNYVSGLKITLKDGVINTSFGATIESGDTYVQIGKLNKEANDGSIAISLKTCSVSTATEDASGLATAYAVKDYVDAQIAGLSAALEFKGEISSSNASTLLTNKATSKGDVYVATGNTFTYNNVTLENGDLAIVKEDAAADTASSIIVVERNLDGAVTAAEGLTENKVILGGGNQTVKATAYSLGLDTYAATIDKDTSVLATEKWVEGAVNTAAKSLTVSTSDNSIYINLLDGSTNAQTLSSVEVKQDSYVTVSANTTDKKGSITIGLNTCKVMNASDASDAKKDGVATALDVQQYVADQLAWHVLS